MIVQYISNMYNFNHYITVSALFSLGTTVYNPNIMHQIIRTIFSFPKSKPIYQFEYSFFCFQPLAYSPNEPSTDSPFARERASMWHSAPCIHPWRRRNLFIHIKNLVFFFFWYFYSVTISGVPYGSSGIIWSIIPFLFTLSIKHFREKVTKGHNTLAFYTLKVRGSTFCCLTYVSQQ